MTLLKDKYIESMMWNLPWEHLFFQGVRSLNDGIVDLSVYE